MVKKTSIWWNSEKEIITASRTTKKGPSWRKMVPAMSHISVLNLAMRESSWLSQKSSGLVFTTERCQWKTEKNFTTMTKIILVFLVMIVHTSGSASIINVVFDFIFLCMKLQLWKNTDLRNAKETVACSMSRPQEWWTQTVYCPP